MKKHTLRNNPQDAPYGAYLPYLLLCPCFLVYCITLQHGFVLDDEAVITKNLFVKKGFAGFGDIFSTFYWRGYWESNAGLYRPLSLIIFAIEWALSPDQPFLFHFVQVGIYMYTIFALYNMLLRLLEGHNKWLPFSIALLFALHPLHTEVVANIKSLDEVLALLFFILGTNWILKKEKYSWQSCLFLFLGLLSKEGAVAYLPIWVLLLVQFKKQSFGAAIKNLAPLAGVAIVWLTIRTAVITNGGPVITYTYLDNSILACSDWLTQRLTAITILGKSLWKIFYPAGMAYDYSYPQIPCATFSSTEFWLAALSLTGLLTAGIYYFKRKPVVSFGILFFFITCFLTSNVFFTIGATMADRFMFTPMLGIILALCYLAFEFTQALNTRKSGISALVILVISAAAGVYTFSAGKDWKSNETLYNKHVKKVPNSARAQYNYGTLLLNASISSTPDSIHKAFDALTIANRLDPKNTDVQVNLGIAYYHMGDFPSAVNWLKKALLVRKDDQTRVNLADAYVKLKQIDSAVFYYKEALDHGYYNVNSHGRVGADYFAAKQYAKAAEVFKKGTVAYPYNGELWLNYGNALAASGDFSNAIPAFEQAYKINPAQKIALYYIAVTYKNMGNMNMANTYMQQYQTAQ